MFIRLQNELLDYFQAEKGLTTEKIQYLKVGFLGAVHFQDQWFRVEVIHLENYPEIGVLLLDKGCFSSVNANEIRRLPDGLNSILMMVLHCSLSGIHRPYACDWDGKSITERYD